MNHSILDRFIKTFRELLLHNHDSLEFRAKIYTIMIMATGEFEECEIKKLEEIASEIYSDSISRQKSLILVVEEYISKVKEPNGLGVDELIYDIEKNLKFKNRFAKKINLEHLEELRNCTDEEENRVYQQRVIEFLQRLKNSYLERV